MILLIPRPLNWQCFEPHVRQLFWIVNCQLLSLSQTYKHNKDWETFPLLSFSLLSSPLADKSVKSFHVCMCLCVFKNVRLVSRQMGQMVDNNQKGLFGVPQEDWSNYDETHEMSLLNISF